MALTLVATAGASNANSYAAIATANAYHEGHLYASLWNAATDEQKAQALVWATQLLDTYFAWCGSVATAAQALGFPRIGTYDRHGRANDNGTIPSELADATSELARKLVASDRTAEPDNTSGEIKEITVGPIGIEYVPGTASGVPIIPDHVIAMLRHLGTYRSGIGGAVTVRRA